jgi:4-amino-4-deoxy-L-arabinose transferase-like glycosyltransferase
MHARPSLSVPPHPPLWRETEWALLAVLVLAIYFSRLTTLTLRGEETRRAQVAAEALRTGDWIVPRQQGTIDLSRPPLGSWAIGTFALWRGRLDVVAIRLPTVLAILLTTLLIFAYARTFLGRLGALAAALAYPTMGQVLEIGRVAETEGLFALLVSGSLLVWHWGYLGYLSAPLTWSAGYVLAAAAGLTKGLQGPIYFVLAVWMYLLLRRDWRYWINRSHLLGITLFVVVLGSWQIPYYLRTDWESTQGIWFKLARDRFTDYTPWVVIRHLVTYPAEILICMLPWSACLVQFLNRRFRAAIADVKPQVLFLVTSLAVAFPSVWLATGARGRYFMPLYPLVALLIGLVIERCWQAEDKSWMRAGWQSYLLVLASVGVLAASVIAVAGWIDHPLAAELAQPRWFSWLFLAVSLALAGILFHSCTTRSLPLAQISLLAIAGFLGLAHTGAVINVQARIMEDTAGAVAQLKSQLPRDVQLVSLGIVDHNFRHHFGEPIATVPWPHRAGRVVDDVRFEYFCFNATLPCQVELPWSWEEVARVSLERNRGERKATRAVIVGRRLDPSWRHTSAAKPTHDMR